MLETMEEQVQRPWGRFILRKKNEDPCGWNMGNPWTDGKGNPKREMGPVREGTTGPSQESDYSVSAMGGLWQCLSGE